MARAILRNLFARETLGEAPESRPGRFRRGPSLARALFAIESLSVEPEPSARPSPRGGLLRALFAIEALGVEPERPPLRRVGLARALFAIERLPGELAEPVEPRRGTPRSRWLRWLFRPESLDPPEVR